MEQETLETGVAGRLAQVRRAHGGADVLVYQGEIDRNGYEIVANLCDQSTGSERAVLILATGGGDANAAYRIARCLGARYASFTALIPRRCKSAGTLVCLGADELVMAARGELGPLDVQVPKRDELLELGSGLDLLQTLGHLQENAFEAFMKFLVDARDRTQLSTQISAQMATQLTVGLYGQIFARIDPLKIGEVQRRVCIANGYGRRLAERSRNVKANALDRLVTGYPNHAFVIDAKEAGTLFERVRPASKAETLIGSFFTNENCEPRTIRFLTEDQDYQTKHGRRLEDDLPRSVEPSISVAAAAEDATPAPVPSARTVIQIDPSAQLVRALSQTP